MPVPCACTFETQGATETSLLASKSSPARRLRALKRHSCCTDVAAADSLQAAEGDTDAHDDQHDRVPT